MKYCNKDPEIRYQSWTKINIDTSTPRWYYDTEEKTQWCKAQNSQGKFYYYYSNWWFELPEDATLFALRWAGPARKTAIDYSIL